MLRKVLIGIAIGAGVIVLAIGGFLFSALQGLPSLEELEHYVPPVYPGIRVVLPCGAFGE